RVAAAVPPPPPPPPDLAKPAVQPPPESGPLAPRADSTHRSRSERATLETRPGRPLSFYTPWALWAFGQVTAFLVAAVAFAYLVRGATAGPAAAPGEGLRFFWVTAFVLGLYAVLLSLGRDPEPGGFRLRWADRRVWAGALVAAATYGGSAAGYPGFAQNVAPWLWVV